MNQQFKFKKKHITFLMSIVFALFFGVNQIWAASQWVDDPNSCNVTDSSNFPGQNCTPDNICGDNSGIAQCYDTTSLTPPTVDSISNTQYTSAYPNGGYLVNCYASVDSAAPYCDNNGNFWCNRNEDCYATQHRDTVCEANSWGSAHCGSCRSGFGDCDGDGGVCEVEFGVTDYPTGAHNNYADCSTAQCDAGWLDCDGTGPDSGNGCEVQDGSTCTINGLQGTYNGCTCVIEKQYFETGTNTVYDTTDPLLWGTQYGSGDLIHFGTNTSPDLFMVNNDGAVQLAQISAPADTTDRLYNVGGTLYWNGSPVGSGGSSTVTASNGLTKVGDDIQLGGDLSQTTYINHQGNDLVVREMAGEPETVFTGDYFKIIDSANNREMRFGAGGSDYTGLYFYGDYQQNIFYRDDSLFINSDNTAFQGLVYANDYSANFVDRSLVDKAYVDNAIISASPWDRDSVNGLIFTKINTDKVGIGTSSPDESLVVYDGNLKISTDGVDPHIILEGRDSGDTWVLGHDEEGNVAPMFYVGYGSNINADNALMRLTSEGGLLLDNTGVLHHGAQLAVVSNGLSSTDSLFLLATASDSNYPVISLYRARNNTSSEAGVLSKDVLGHIGFSGKNSATVSTHPKAYMEGVAIDDWTNTSQGASLNFYATPVGSTTPRRVFSVNGDGKLTVAIANYESLLNDVNDIPNKAYVDSHVGTSIFDSDSDTGIQVEANADEDFIRMQTAGVERFLIDNQGRMRLSTNPSAISRACLFEVGEGSESSTFAVQADSNYLNIATFRDQDGENIFRAKGSLANGDLSVAFGDIDWAYNNLAFDINQSTGAFDMYGGGFRLHELGASHSDYVGFIAPNDVTTNTVWTLPASDGTNGQVLATDGSGGLFWRSLDSGVFDTDNDTGLWVEKNADEDYLRFETAGVERMYIDNSGIININKNQFVGITNETSSPSADYSLVIGSRADNDSTRGVEMKFTQTTGNGGYITFRTYQQGSAWSHDIMTLTNDDATVYGPINAPSFVISTYDGSNDTSLINGVLHLASATDNYIRFTDDGAQFRGIIGFQNGSPDLVYKSGATSFSDGTERFRITNTGNVRINDAYTLPNTDGSAGQVLQTDGAGNVSWADAGSASSIWDADHDTGIELEQNPDEDKIHFNIGDASGTAYPDAMLLDSNGYLGVGTSNPSYRFDLIGESSIINSSIRLANYANIGAGPPAVLLHRAGGSVSSPTAVTSDMPLGAILAGGYDGSSMVTYAGGLVVDADEDWTSSAHGTHLEFWVTGNGTTSTGSKMTLTNQGYLRIGDSVIPQTVLDIDSNASNDVPIFSFGNNGGRARFFRVDADPENNIVGDIGDLAFDTTNGNLYLKHSNSGANTGWINISTTVSSASSIWDADNDTGIQVEESTDEDMIRFDIGDSSGAAYPNAMVLNSYGYLGIGTESPAEKLVVYGGNMRLDTGTTDGETKIDFYDDTSVSGQLGFVQDTFGNGASGMVLRSDLAMGFSRVDKTPLLTIQENTNNIGLFVADAQYPLELKKQIDSVNHNVLASFENTSTGAADGFLIAHVNNYGIAIGSTYDAGAHTSLVTAFDNNNSQYNPMRIEFNTLALVPGSSYGTLNQGVYINNQGYVGLGTDQIPAQLVVGEGGTIDYASGDGAAYIKSILEVDDTVYANAYKAGLTGTASSPTYSFIGDSNTGIYNPSANTLAFSSGGSEKFEINSLENIFYDNPLKLEDSSSGNGGCIRYNNSIGELEYSNDCNTYNSFSASSAGGWTDDGTVVRLTTASDSVVIGANSLSSGNTPVLGLTGDSTISEVLLEFGDVTDSDILSKIFYSGNALILQENASGNGGAFIIKDYNTETLRSVNNGIVINDGSDPSIDFRVEGDTENYLLFTDASTDAVGIKTGSPRSSLDVLAQGATVATFDRIDTDGTIISLRQDGIEEGTITVTGSTVSYNAFTGSHYVWTDDSKNLERGYLVELTGNNKYLHNNTDSEILYGVKLVTEKNSPKVLGAYLAKLEPTQEESIENPSLVMASGNGDLWVVDKGENIEAGDYLISSDVAGHAEKIDSDLAVNYVIARAAESVDWSKVDSYKEGYKHKKISVLFENLVINNNTASLVDNLKKSKNLLAKDWKNKLENTLKTLNNRSDIIQKEKTNQTSGIKQEIQYGQTIIPARRSLVKVKFDHKFSSKPLVFLTLASNSNLMRYYVTDVSESGFTLNLYPTQKDDTVFNWQAVLTNNTNIIEETENKIEEEKNRVDENVEKIENIKKIKDKQNQNEKSNTINKEKEEEKVNKEIDENSNNLDTEKENGVNEVENSDIQNQGENQDNNVENESNNEDFNFTNNVEDLLKDSIENVEEDDANILNLDDLNDGALNIDNVLDNVLLNEDENKDMENSINNENSENELENSDNVDADQENQNENNDLQNTDEVNQDNNEKTENIDEGSSVETESDLTEHPNVLSIDESLGNNDSLEIENEKNNDNLENVNEENSVNSLEEQSLNLETLFQNLLALK